MDCSTCVRRLETHGIVDVVTYKRWIVANHPDKAKNKTDETLRTEIMRDVITAFAIAKHILTRSVSEYDRQQAEQTHKADAARKQQEELHRFLTKVETERRAKEVERLETIRRAKEATEKLDNERRAQEVERCKQEAERRVKEAAEKLEDERRTRAARAQREWEIRFEAENETRKKAETDRKAKEKADKTQQFLDDRKRSIEHAHKARDERVLKKLDNDRQIKELFERQAENICIAKEKEDDDTASTAFGAFGPKEDAHMAQKIFERTEHMRRINERFRKMAI